MADAEYTEETLKSIWLIGEPDQFRDWVANEIGRAMRAAANEVHIHHDVNQPVGSELRIWSEVFEDFCQDTPTGFASLLRNMAEWAHGEDEIAKLGVILSSVEEAVAEIRAKLSI